MSIAEFNALRTSFKAARAAKDWDAALQHLDELEFLLASTPNLARSIGGSGNQSITWNSATIDSLRSSILRQKASAAQASSGPFTLVPVTYARPDVSGDYQ